MPSAAGPGRPPRPDSRVRGRSAAKASGGGATMTVDGGGESSGAASAAAKSVAPKEWIE